MFDDATMADEEEIGMIDSITEEDDSDEAHRKGAGGHRPSGVTLSEVSNQHCICKCIFPSHCNKNFSFVCSS